jgi:hypothetical protein
MQNYNVAICMLTCELDHLEEWYDHHRNMGFENFLIFLDGTVIKSTDIDQKLSNKIKNLKILQISSQKKPILGDLYTAVCKKYNHYDYILFIDSDEYYMSKTNNIIQDINLLTKIHGYFDGLAIYWKFYGAIPPFENRVPITSYKQYYESRQIKTLVNPKTVTSYTNPHFAGHSLNKYIDEKGKRIDVYQTLRPAMSPKPQLSHSSDYVWIKHIHTRSKSEWLNKINRKNWYQHIHGFKLNLNSFNVYNSRCIIQDV